MEQDKNQLKTWVVMVVSINNSFSEHDDAQFDGMVCLDIDSQAQEDDSKKFHKYYAYSKFMTITYNQGIRNIQRHLKRRTWMTIGGRRANFMLIMFSLMTSIPSMLK